MVGLTADRRVIRSGGGRRGEGALNGSPSPRARSLTLLAVAAVIGVAVGRFLAFDAPPVASVAPARTPEAMIAALEEAVAGNPDDLRSLQALGLAYLRRAAQIGDPSFFSLAEEALDRADRLAPTDSRTLLARGALALARHEFAPALRLATQAHQADPFDAEALGVMVDAQVELGRYDDAARRLQQMLDLRPGLAALSRVSYLRELRGDLPGAMEAMHQARTAGAGSPFDVAVVEALLGDLSFSQGDVDAAEGAYRRALELSPELVTAWVGRARLEAARGDAAGAIEELQDVTARFPQQDALILLGELLSSEGREDEAEAVYELVRVIARLQEEAGQVVDLEMALFEADHGRPEQAVNLARRAYAVRPTIYAADALAWSLAQAGEAQAARSYLAEAKRLGTADALFHFHAAVIYEQVGDTNGGRRELGQAFETNPWFTFFLRNRATELADRLGVPVPSEWGR
ncbi:MAG: tetratricopeptide repeat protein [Acidimicrobiia bacterium]